MMKWGGYCPVTMSWNKGRLQKGLCEKWQYELYSTWYTFGSSYTLPKVFYDFRVFVYWFQHTKYFESYKETPEFYDYNFWKKTLDNILRK